MKKNNIVVGLYLGVTLIAVAGTLLYSRWTQKQFNESVDRYIKAKKTVDDTYAKFKAKISKDME